MTLVEWIQGNISFEYGEVVAAVLIAICFLVCYDFYHMLFSAVLTWFKKS